MQISKSDYMLYLRHPAWLWLKKHDKSKLPPIDEDTQAIFDAGFLFESYAEQLFDHPVKLGFDNYREYLDLPKRTKEAIDRGSKTIMQGRLESGDITCIFDVLVRVHDNIFDLYEIKSSTCAKIDHEYDLAFQREVLVGSGYQVNKIFVIHANPAYIRDGEVSPQDLCQITEVTDLVLKRQKFTQKKIAEALSVVEQKVCPDISPKYANIYGFSDWVAIYKTLAELDEYSIYHLCMPVPHKLGELEKLGINRIHEIPDSFELNEKQKRQVLATKTDSVLVDEDKIAKFLGTLKYPLYFFDYETLSSVVPQFDGLGPYKQLPFQYSLHVLERPDSELKHFEYLHSNNSNPIEPLTETLISQIGREGSVLVWYQPFEKSCNQLMGKMAPKYKEFYKELNDRIEDLMTPFANGHYVHKDFFGSASIKKVLPVLIPELSYKDMDINQGAAAQRLWMEAILHGKRGDQKDKILADLLKYCELDTLAMVRIYQFLDKLVSRQKSDQMALPFGFVGN